MDQTEASNEAAMANEGTERGPGRHIAYLIPEFPAQTHDFFWRERKRLQRLGDEVDLFTTGDPPPELRARHDWVPEALGRTSHLVPKRPAEVARVAGELLRAGPKGWRRVASCFARSEAPSLKDRAKLAAAVVLGARLAAESRRMGVEHVHVHSCANSANVALFAHQLSGLSYSLTLHNPLECYGPNQPEKWRHARFGIVITETIRAEVEADLKGALPPQLFVAPMGVDEEHFKRDAPYVPYAGEGRFRIFSCSRLHPVKGVDDLIRAIAKLSADGVDAEVFLAGADDVGGSYERSLRELAGELSVTDRVHFLGSCSSGQILAELRQAHAFALLSHAEPLGIAIAEAMAVEVPVVVTNAGGVPELVDDQVSGLLVPPFAPDEAAAALRKLATDPELAARLAPAGREVVIESFSSGRSARAIHEGVTARV